MTVLVLHTLPPPVVRQDRDAGEFDLHAAAHNVAAALPDAMVAGVRGEASEIMHLLAVHQPDVVFNLCEAPLGRPDLEAHVAALLEWTGVRFTGSGSETLALCRRKDFTKGVLQLHGIATPRAGVFPCIVKPAGEDGSAGVHEESICADEREVERARQRVNGPVIVEEFLPGREFVVSLWGAREPEHVSIGETCFQHGLRLITYAAKWDVSSAHFADTPLHYDLELSDTLRQALVTTARSAWHAVGIKGYVRVDLRLDHDSVPCVLDINPNPELGPGVGVCNAVQQAGWSWEHFVRKQVEWA